MIEARARGIRLEQDGGMSQTKSRIDQLREMMRRVTNLRPEAAF